MSGYDPAGTQGVPGAPGAVVVSSVNGKIGAVVLTVADIAGAAPAVEVVAKTTAPLNPADYGVTFDGVTDDTAALNAFFLNTVAAGDAVLLPRNKVARTTANVTIPVAKTGLTLDGNGSEIRLDPAAANGTIVITNNAPKSTIRNLTVNGSSVTSSTGIRPKAANQRITGCRLIACIAGGVYIETGATTDLSIDNNTFSGDGYGVLCANNCTAARIAVRDNTFIGGPNGDAIEFNSPTGPVTDVIITGNLISGYSNIVGSGIGIGLANVQGGVVANNVITDCGNDAIHIEDASTRITVVANRILRCARAGVSLQIGAGTTVAPSGCAVIGNTIEGCLTRAGSGAIALEGATGVTKARIIGNVVRNNGRAGGTCYGIELGSGGLDNLCADNAVFNTTGATTAGIRWSTSTDMIVSGNRCGDDQGVKTQQYGMTVVAISTNVIVTGNDLSGNLTGTINDTTMSSGSSGYLKRHNRPSGIDGPTQVPVVNGAVSDASFGPVSLTNGAIAIDGSNNRLYVKHGNAWHYVALT